MYEKYIDSISLTLIAGTLISFLKYYKTSKNNLINDLNLEQRIKNIEMLEQKNKLKEEELIKIENKFKNLEIDIEEHQAKKELCLKKEADLNKREYEVKKKEEEVNLILKLKDELKLKEENLNKSIENLRIREEVIINMENSFSKSNDQLSLLITSLNRFSDASNNIVKACNENFCVIKQ